MARWTLVLAVDFSPTSRAALDAARELARDLDARVILVHAFQTRPRPRAGTGKGRPDPLSQVALELQADEAVELSTEWGRLLRDTGLDVECVARAGRAADVVLEEARKQKAHLIVIGTHGRTGIMRAAFGSVAEAVVRRSSVPVLAVPTPRARRRK